MEEEGQQQQTTTTKLGTFTFFLASVSFIEIFPTSFISPLFSQLLSYLQPFF